MKYCLAKCFEDDYNNVSTDLKRNKDIVDSYKYQGEKIENVLK